MIKKTAIKIVISYFVFLIYLGIGTCNEKSFPISTLTIIIIHNVHVRMHTRANNANMHTPTHIPFAHMHMNYIEKVKKGKGKFFLP